MYMQNNFKKQKGGFVQVIILIIIGLVILKFLNLSISDVATWFKTFFSEVLR